MLKLMYSSVYSRHAVNTFSCHSFQQIPLIRHILDSIQLINVLHVLSPVDPRDEELGLVPDLHQVPSDHADRVAHRRLLCGLRQSGAVRVPVGEFPQGLPQGT